MNRKKYEKEDTLASTPEIFRKILKNTLFLEKLLAKGCKRQCLNQDFHPSVKYAHVQKLSLFSRQVFRLHIFLFGVFFFFRFFVFCFVFHSFVLAVF